MRTLRPNLRISEASSVAVNPDLLARRCASSRIARLKPCGVWTFQIRRRASVRVKNPGAPSQWTVSRAGAAAAAAPHLAADSIT
jgi:hypothetical protein